MEILDLKSSGVINRVAFNEKSTNNIVESIKKRVLTRGDSELIALTRKYDGVSISNLRVPKAKIDQAYKSVSKQDLEVILRAAERIEKVNETILKARKNKVEVMGIGYRFRLITRAIESVGLYVPGGTAFYPSSLLMLGIPAKVAGVKRIVLATPPNIKDKGIPAITLATAKLIGINEIYQVGGAQAIFAMAYGTESIKKVDKIFGPGNKYVNTAKMMLRDKCGIDIFAGPSEILILADRTANPEYIKADLQSQAEHGHDSPLILVTTSRKLANRMSGIDRGYAVIVKSIKEGIAFTNKYRAEHTQVITKNAEDDALKIQGAAVFIGPKTCVPMGDYGVTGANHVLPTAGASRFQSPVSVESFLVSTEYSEVTDPAKAAAYVPRFAEMEQLPAHANAVNLRIKNAPNN